VPYVLYANSAEGLMIGSRVMVAGIRAGSVSKMELDPEMKGVKVTIEIAPSYQVALRQDTTAEISTEGVLGDRVISLSMGSASATQLRPGMAIPIRATANLRQVVNSGSNLLTTLNRVADEFHAVIAEFRAHGKTQALLTELTHAAKSVSTVSTTLDRELKGIQLKSSIAQLDEILTKLNRGTGTLGALINDPVLYDDAKALVGEANQNRIVRNLVRKTIRDSEAQQAGAAAQEGTDPTHDR
jgi:phospholipid/cholesterol/gamma-HCH transport system substrate-binding protein